MAEYLWTLAYKFNADFTLKEKTIAALENIEYERFVELIKESLGRENTKRLAILMQGATPEKHLFRYEPVSSSALRSIGKYVAVEKP